MSKFFLISILFLFIEYNLYTQSEKPNDKRPQIEKEDSINKYKQENITTLDLLEALELASIRIHKFDIGIFVKEYKLLIFADEYTNGILIKTDTIVNFNNEYAFWIDGELNLGFIDQIKIFTKTDENLSTLYIKTYSFETTKKIKLDKTDSLQFFNWREYEKTNWKLNEKIPLLIFASSWLDKEYNVHRFCGVVNLKENDSSTQELLTKSPNYIVINYKISEIE